jgi:hypothetical protein
MWIENAGGQPLAKIRESIARLEDHELLASEISQKAAIHALTFLIRLGASELNAKRMLDSMDRVGCILSEECIRRGLATVDHLGGN